MSSVTGWRGAAREPPHQRRLGRSISRCPSAGVEERLGTVDEVDEAAEYRDSTRDETNREKAGQTGSIDDQTSTLTA